MAELQDRLADLKLLVQSIPEEIQGDATSNAADRLFTFIEYHAQNDDEATFWAKFER